MFHVLQYKVQAQWCESTTSFERIAAEKSQTLVFFHINDETYTLTDHWILMPQLFIRSAPHDSCNTAS